MELAPKLEYLLHIGIILLGAQLGGIVSKRLKQPVVLGQILVGIFLGIDLLEKTEIISQLGEIGVIFLMFIAGLETDVNELKLSGKSSATIAVLGVFIPICLTSSAAYIMGQNITSSIILGLISIATSVSISVQTLKEIGFLRTKQGVAILGAAIIDDIIGIILLTVTIGMVRPSAGNSIMSVIFKICVFFVIAFIIGYFIISLIKKAHTKYNMRKIIVSYALIFCLLLAYVSEDLGVAAVTGAYFAGVILSMTPYRHKISHDIQVISDSFFTPIFFISIGLGVEIQELGYAIGFSMVLLILGIIGKIVGCGIGARATDFSVKESLQIGIGMVPRAEVSIIIANLALSLNLIGHKEFSSAILLVVATTLITPSLLKWSFKGYDKDVG